MMQKLTINQLGDGGKTISLSDIQFAYRNYDSPYWLPQEALNLTARKFVENVCSKFNSSISNSPFLNLEIQIEEIMLDRSEIGSQLWARFVNGSELIIAQRKDETTVWSPIESHFYQQISNICDRFNQEKSSLKLDIKNKEASYELLDKAFESFFVKNVFVSDAKKIDQNFKLLLLSELRNLLGDNKEVSL